MRRKMPAIPPARSIIATAIQPDYDKWQAVRVGMTRSEVTALLGPSLTGREQRTNRLWDAAYPAYGFVSYPALPSKWEMLFRLGFDREDRVCWKCDPFGGAALSRNGKPSKPRMILPQKHSQFTHYPRLLDVRWFPCSGIYPMTYELEFGIASPGGKEYSAHVDPQRFGQPYALISFPGAQAGRIRVRGRNAKGIGPWSEYVEFEFEV